MQISDIPYIGSQQSRKSQLYKDLKLAAISVPPVNITASFWYPQENRLFNIIVTGTD